MTKKLMARFLLTFGFVMLAVLFAWEVFAEAEELTIVEARRNIPLADTDPVFQDYYINSGNDQGLKQNLVVTAVRKIAVRDATGTQSYGDMQVPVGQLKIIAVGEKFAVAREYKIIPRDEQPMLEQTGIMIGDKIDIKGSFVDNHKLPVKKPAQTNAPVIKPDEKTEKIETAKTPVPPLAPAPTAVPVTPTTPAAATTAASKVVAPVADADKAKDVKAKTADNVQAETADKTDSDSSQLN